MQPPLKSKRLCLIVSGMPQRSDDVKLKKGIAITNEHMEVEVPTLATGYNCHKNAHILFSVYT